MAVFRILLGLIVLAAQGHTLSISASRAADDVILSLEPVTTGGFLLALINKELVDDKLMYGHIGRTLMPPYTTYDIEGGVEIHMDDVQLQVLTVYDDAADARGIKIRWDTNTTKRLEDCIDFGLKHWYGGPMQLNQVYPIETSNIQYSAYVTKEDDNGAIAERYWLNSAGEYLYVHPEVPLFVDYNYLSAHRICFGAQIAAPYSSKRNHTSLAYDIWFLSDAKTAHKHAVANYLGKPSATPDYRMTQHPIWSTWAQFGKDINDTNLLEFAQEIKDHGFSNSQFEIDDLWEICYGSLTVDEERFPNMTEFVKQIKELGYRVTIWAHPFINRGCEPWYTEALTKGYFVLNEQSSPDTVWWDANDTVAGYIDFTNQEAADWWHDRLRTLLDTHGIDNLKFDAGESSWSPEVSVQTGDTDLHPHHIVQAYVRTCARFGSMIEVRTGFQTQDLPIFIRMVDRDSIWGLNNGLSTIITTTLQMNLNGYPFVLPDMIGGNGFQLDHETAQLPTKELVIRWVQANAFLPVLQFSFMPWNFDNETSEISKKYADLHASYADKIYAAMEASVKDGTPVNAPLWWADPHDNVTHTIWDEYLLGEDILVAPVLTPNTTSRSIYLPKGTWFESGDPEKPLEGPIWIEDYPAPLDVLPYFVRDASTGAASVVRLATGLMIFVGACFFLGL